MVSSGVMDPAITNLQNQISGLGAKIEQLQRNLRSSANLANTTIMNGSLTFADANGNPAVVVGLQSDGTLTSKVLGTVVPPKAPSTPVAGSGINGIWVSWDGLMNDGTTPLADFAAVQVHMSASQNFTPSAATLQGHMLGAGLFGIGPLTPGTTYYVAFMALNDAGNLGPASQQASANPISVPASLTPGSLSGLTITTGTITSAQIAAAAGILGSQIAQGSITSSNILAGSITAALLAANLVIAGAVDGTIITGSTLRNSAIDPKTSINPDGSITITNNASATIFSVGPDGTLNWYSSSGQLLMELQPGGTQLIYASLTGPSGWNFEPDAAPSVIGTLTSATSSATYTMACTAPAPAGQAVQVIATSSGATAVTNVTDSNGNIYTLTQTVISGQEVQVWRCDYLVAGLTTADTWTITYAAANTQTKTVVALTEAGLASAGLQDFAGTASGTSTTPAATATSGANNAGDCVLFIVATPTAPSAVADGWALVESLNTSGGTWLSIYYSTTYSGATSSASATITSGAWGAVILGLKPAPLQPVSSSTWTGVNANLALTTTWSSDGSFALKATASSTASPWGALSPVFAVQGGSNVSMQATIEAPAALAGVTVGFYWYDATNTQIGSTVGDLGTVPCGTGSITQFTVTGATAPAAAVWGQFYVTDSDTTSGLVMNIDSVQVPGGLVFSNSPTGGTDQFGNVYEQGINFVGLPGLTNVFGVEDPYGSQLLSIDAMGNIQAQTINASVDLKVGGNSVSSLLTGAAQGIVARGWVGGVTYPWPSTAISTTETAILELDVQLQAGRLYKIVSESALVATGVTSWARHYVRYTSDGTTPTTSSALLMRSEADTGGTNTASIPQIENFIAPSSSATYRFLLSVQTGGGGSALKYQDGSGGPAMHVEDVGLASGVNTVNTGTTLGSGSSGGSTNQTITQSWTPQQTYSYYGSQVGQGKRGTGTLYQGCASGQLSSTGDQYSFIEWPASLFTTLSAGGVTINSMKLRLTNLHSWYNSGCYVILGYCNFSTFGAYGNLSGATLDETNYFMSEGSTLTYDLGVNAPTFVSAVQGGHARSFVLGPSSSTSGGASDLYNYGYFYGVGNSAKCPTLTVNYTT